MKKETRTNSSNKLDYASIPEHNLGTYEVVVKLDEDKWYQLCGLNSEGNRSNFHIQDLLHLFRIVPQLIDLNSRRGLVLKNLTGVHGDKFVYGINVRKSNHHVVGGSKDDKSSISFDYANYLDTKEFCNCVDRVEYPTSGLEENLEKTVEELDTLYPIQRKHHRIGFGGFA